MNNKSTIKSLLLGLLCLFGCVTMNVSAQTTAVGKEFHGEWTFDHAQAQERPMNSEQAYTSHTVLQDDLQSNNHFHGIPTQITFMENGTAQVFSLAHTKSVTAAVNPDGNIFFFVEEQEIDVDGKKETIKTVTATFPNFQRSDNTMSMQYQYFYGEGKNAENYTEGLLTIYYKR
jgi:hypothetical protein